MPLKQLLGLCFVAFPLISLPAVAQGERSDQGGAELPAPSAPPLVTGLDSSASPAPPLAGASEAELGHADPSRGHAGADAGRFALEVLGGSLLGGTLGVAGGLGGCLGLSVLAAGSNPMGVGFYCGLGGAMGLIVGDLTGVLAGTVLIGSLLEGSGEIWATVLGELGGAALGALVFLVPNLVPYNPSFHGNPVVAVVAYSVALLAPAIGAAAGFELTSVNGRSDSQKPGSSRLSVVPMIAPTERGGATLGVAGLF